jgi:hypothetical protein
VPYDFDWSRERAIVDDQFMELYSQLPYDAHFSAVFDCCHSGGMTRDGLVKARGLNPPDDIRHRALRWDPEAEVWKSRELDFARRRNVRPRADKACYVGERGATKRLGRAVTLRPDYGDFKRDVRKYGHKGPYMPILIEACREGELSFEYRHGVTSYGAFTYCLTTAYRQFRRTGRHPTFPALISDVTRRLTELRFDQHPVLVMPSEKKRRPIPYPALRPAHGTRRRAG